MCLNCHEKCVKLLDNVSVETKNYERAKQTLYFIM